MVVKSLEEAIPTVTLKQESHPDNQTQAVYANDQGNTLLQSIEQLRKETSEMKEELVLLRPLRKETQQLEEEVASLLPLRKETKQLKEEVASLLPFRRMTVGIRERFFAYYRRKEKLGGVGIRLTIETGNKMAHDGDVVTDVCLFESGQMIYYGTFAKGPFTYRRPSKSLKSCRPLWGA